MTTGRAVKAAMLVVLLVGAAGSAFALEIKLASVAPSNSPYAEALERLAADWERISNGTVNVHIYENGIAGNQADMLRMMRIGEIQGGLFASTGLANVARGALSVSVPYLIRNDAEFNYVMKNLRPILNAEAERHGFKAVVWAEAGWAYLFSKKPVTTPDQARRLRLAVPTKEQTLIDTFKTLGYRPIPVDLTETLSALNSGMVNAVFASPSLAAGYQWFGIANYMTDQKIAPVLGSVLIDKRTWERIPAEYRPQFEQAAHRAEAWLQESLHQFDNRAIRIMRSYGLKLVPITQEQQHAWQAELEKHWRNIVGPVFDASTVQLIEKDLREYRAAEVSAVAQRASQKR